MSPRFAGEYWWPFGISNGLAGVLVTWAEPRSIFVFFFGILDAMIAPTPFDILPFLVLGSFSWTLFCPFVDPLSWNGSISSGLVGVLVTWAEPRSIFDFLFLLNS